MFWVAHLWPPPVGPLQNDATPPSVGSQSRTPVHVDMQYACRSANFTRRQLHSLNFKPRRCPPLQVDTTEIHGKLIISAQ